MKRILILLSLFVLMGASSCSTMADIETLCIMEPEREMCWINRDEGRGVLIKDMLFWYSMDERDFKQILKRLRECDKNAFQE